MDFGIQSAVWQIVGRLGLVVLVGSVLGINRNLRRKPAGIRFDSDQGDTPHTR